MTKPIKPSKSLIYCYACKRRKMLFREQSEADNFIKYNHGGILEENGKAPDRTDRFLVTFRNTFLRKSFVGVTEGQVPRHFKIKS